VTPNIYKVLVENPKGCRPLEIHEHPVDGTVNRMGI
jgi:hypothetical protein